jgi:DNA polymerase-3 subunit delta
MPERPVVYLFHGDDEPAIHGEIDKLKARVAGPGVLEMNFTRLDGRSLAFNDLVTACMAMPFIAERRLVVLDFPLAYAKDEANQEKFVNFIAQIPSSTALVLIEHQPLSTLLTKEEKKLGKRHWLEDWAFAAGSRVYVKKMAMLEAAGGVAGWIQKRAATQGGEFTGRAAARLAELSAADASILDQEINKLLTYVGRSRPVEVQDVERLAVEIPEADIFALVDALGNRDGRSAAALYHRLLAVKDIQSIFPMIVRQFRLLLLCREILESGKSETDAAHLLELHPFVSRKLYAQARQFTLPVLEEVYHNLLAIDSAAKLGEIDPELNLDLWMAELTE